MRAHRPSLFTHLQAALKTADVYMSHEGLQLAYEAALTRPVPLPALAASSGCE